MDYNNDANLLATLDKIGVNHDTGVIIDNWAAGPIAEITPDDIQTIIDAVKNGPLSILRNNKIRVTITELAQLFELPQRAYQFMYACSLLKNKFGSPIYSLTPFGNFTSLHYQGRIENAVLPEIESPMPNEELKDLVEADRKLVDEQAKEIDAVNLTGEQAPSGEVAGAVQGLDSPSNTDKLPDDMSSIPKEVVDGEKPDAKEEKPKTSQKSETKSPAKRTPRKRS